jgi:hypothetical protein
MKRTMEQNLRCVASLAIMCIASVACAHSSAIPLVDLTITLDKNTLTYETSVPTFAFEPKHPAKYLIWEAYPTQAIADRMKKEFGLISIEFSPCELLSEDDISNGANYLNVMQDNLKNVAAIFDGPTEK